ncbi:hypothetical protein [Moorena sp. SIO4G3]|uniref:hypothetical protein n=1 Tax=Moorena sp. SIO4G3 TaxID=2607821 RepID=UPI00142C2A98|nr:hypothetical protein [Moorena sp. SIO4G3]NEO79274.1 hypothetical protein [Moorena sp. SIO4G3]
MTISTTTGNQQQLTLTCNPPVWLGKPDTSSVILGQQVGFLLGGRELLPLSEFLPSVTTTSSDPSPDQKTNSLVFDITGIAAGDYWVRLPVDGGSISAYANLVGWANGYYNCWNGQILIICPPNPSLNAIALGLILVKLLMPRYLMA